jgi:hypothetical protein
MGQDTFELMEEFSEEGNNIISAIANSITFDNAHLVAAELCKLEHIVAAQALFRELKHQLPKELR